MSSGAVGVGSRDGSCDESGGRKMTELPFKVLVIGDSTVGKTSFTDRYTSNKFKGEYKSTQGGTLWADCELRS